MNSIHSLADEIVVNLIEASDIVDELSMFKNESFIDDYPNIIDAAIIKINTLIGDSIERAKKIYEQSKGEPHDQR